MQNTIFLYGQPGYGKTTLAATFPKPLLHLCFDPASKARPMHSGEIVEHDDLGMGVPGLLSQSGVQTELCGKIAHTQGFPVKLRKRLCRVEGHWKTVVIDSCTTLGYLWRYWNEEFTRNKDNEKLKDPRKHYGYATEQFDWIFNIAMGRIPAKYIIVIAHMTPVKDEKTGEISEGRAKIGKELLCVPHLPGKLSVTAGSVFSEVWRMYVDKQKGERFYRVQTQPDGFYLAHTSTDAPNGVEANFSEFGGLI